MTIRTVETAPQTYARIAGLLYLIVIAAGVFAEIFVRGRLIVSRDAAATAQNILAHELLYRLGFAVSLVYLACNIPLALIFYRLLRIVNSSLSLMLAFFILVGTAVESGNLLNHFAPLIILKGGEYASTFHPEQIHALVYMSLRLFAIGFNLCLVFFGFYCLLTGYLIYRSIFLPRIIGSLMLFGGLCYLTHSFANFLAPQFARYLIPYILAPCLAAEGSLCLWLIVKGINVPKWEEQASVLQAGTA